MDKREQKIMDILRYNAEQYLEKSIKNFKDANTCDDEDTSMLLIDEGMKNQYVSVELGTILRQIVNEVFRGVVD